MKRASLLAAAAAALLACTAAVAARQPTLDQLASFVAGKPVHVDCRWMLTDPTLDGPGYASVGLTVPGSDLIQIWKLYCRDLQRSLAHPKQAANAQDGAALLILAHEAEHARGFRDETFTECAAMRILPRLFVRAGVPTSLRRRVMSEAEEFDRQLPVDYHETPCEDTPANPPRPAAVSCTMTAPTVQFTETLDLATRTARFTISCPQGVTLGNLVWRFGDGDQATGIASTATHTYRADGRYEVSITWTDAGGAHYSLSHGVEFDG